MYEHGIEYQDRKLIFVGGKGGVGKTTVSLALAKSLAQNSRVLYFSFEDPSRPLHALERLGDRLWALNAEALRAFEEYIALKIGNTILTRVFVQNKLIKYLAKAAPGIHELVLLGKVWHERENYDHIVVDMPSTGYGLAMFHSVRNFFQLFRGGPIHRDTEKMLASFGDPAETAHLILALPEEMPLCEALEYGEELGMIFPKNPAHFVLNRKFPVEAHGKPLECLYAKSAPEYCWNRAALEAENLELWKRVKFTELPYLPPRETPEEMASALAESWSKRA